MPLACNLNAIASTERPHYRELVTRLRRAMSNRRELESGYCYHLNILILTLPEVAEWITLERQCCPFIDFQLDVSSQGTYLTLHGSDGVKEIIQRELPAE